LVARQPFLSKLHKAAHPLARPQIERSILSGKPAVNIKQNALLHSISQGVAQPNNRCIAHDPRAMASGVSKHQIASHQEFGSTRASWLIARSMQSPGPLSTSNGQPVKENNVTEAIVIKWFFVTLPDAGLAIVALGFFALGLLTFLYHDPYRELSRPCPRLGRERS
jgi:hypothetical protein